MWAPVLHPMVICKIQTGGSFGYMAPEKYFKYDWHYDIPLASRGRAEQLLNIWMDIAKDVYPDAKTPMDYADNNPDEYPYFGKPFIPYAESDIE